jgi:hypothetical protein
MASFQQVETTWQRFGSMINTGMILAAALGFVWKGGRDAEALENSISKNASSIERIERDQGNKWLSHEQYHKDRLGETKELQGKIEARLNAVENNTAKVERKQDNFDFRLTQAEQSGAATASAMKDIQTVVSKQSVDLGVAIEILKRLEAIQRGRPGE